MRFPSAVSLSIDFVFMLDWRPTYLALHPYVSATVPPLSPPTNMQPHIEVGTPQYWPPGVLLGKNKFSDNVVHQGRTFVLEGHDLGPLIVHVSIPPDNPMQITTMMGSSRKAKFTAGEVRANGKGVACCYISPIPSDHVPAPMTHCSQLCAMPLAGSGSAAVANSLIVGQHWIDILADTVALVAESILTAALNDKAKLPTGGVEEQFQDGASEILLGGNPFSPQNGGAGKAARKAIPGGVGSFLRGLIAMSGQSHAGYRGPGGYNFHANMGVAQVQWDSTRDYNSEGEERWSHQGHFKVGGEGLNLHGAVDVSQGESGGLQSGSSLGVGNPTQETDLHYSTDRPEEVGGGEGAYWGTESPLSGAHEHAFGESDAPEDAPTPENLPEL